MAAKEVIKRDPAEVMKDLPEVCYARNPADNSPVLLKRGVVGYWPAKPGVNPETENERMGVNVAQEEAMMCGSIAGFDVPGGRSAQLHGPHYVRQARGDAGREEAGCGMSIWRLAHRFDREGVALADRHYSRQKPGSPQFMPPGSCRVLVAKNSKAVFGLSFPKAEFVRHAWAGAWVVSIFRNEKSGPYASDMIREAMAHMQTEYEVPELGCVTFVDPKKVDGVMERGERIKGFCFHKAGFSAVGETKKGLIAWQMLPAAMPPVLAITAAKGAI